MLGVGFHAEGFKERDLRKKCFEYVLKALQREINPTLIIYTFV